MIAKICSAIPYGYDGRIVEVEGDITKSLPAFNIVGMANKTISEARERVRSALVNSGFTFPDKKVTINLAPAELAKDGTHLDLPIALATLILSKQLLQSDVSDKIFVGELSLDGLTRPVRGIINIIETAKNAGYSEIYIPKDNLAQARLVSGITIIGVSNLTELLLHLKGAQTILTPTPAQPVNIKNTKTDGPILDDVRGQDLIKRALIIAIAGRHNILLSGPPGAGKTLLAKVAANLLPPPSTDEQIAITKLHSLCGESDHVFSARPFRAPHHTASNASIIGGGPNANPGEISLAHHGVLFLDELPEYPRSVLEALRQPLEDKMITITRANQKAAYPADFMLISTMNPCPCGYYGDPAKECTCTTGQIENYRHRISGPILDRIDMIINVEKVKSTDLLLSITHAKNTHTDNIAEASGTNHADSTSNRSVYVKNTNTDYIRGVQHQEAQKEIQAAILRQYERYKRHDFYNSSLSSRDIPVYVKITKPGQKLLQEAAERLDLSARAYFKLIKLAQTIADLANLTEVGAEQISEALSFRQQLP